jgi:hypothetical protein
MSSEKLKKEWEIQFEDRLNPDDKNTLCDMDCWYPESEFGLDPTKIKSFISSLLAKQQEEFVKEVEEIIRNLKYPPYSRNVDPIRQDGYSQALADIKSKLNKTNE